MTAVNLSRKYIDYIRTFSPETQEFLLKGAGRTMFRTSIDLPDDLAIFSSANVTVIIDLPPDLVEAFCGDGVRIPNTNYKIRNAVGMLSVCELATGTEPELPSNWKELVK